MFHWICVKIGNYSVIPTCLIYQIRIWLSITQVLWLAWNNEAKWHEPCFLYVLYLSTFANTTALNWVPGWRFSTLKTGRRALSTLSSLFSVSVTESELGAELCPGAHTPPFSEMAKGIFGNNREHTCPPSSVCFTHFIHVYNV